MVVGAAAPVLIAAAGLAFYAMGDAVSLFYSPFQAKAAHVPTVHYNIAPISRSSSRPAAQTNHAALPPSS